MLNVHLISHSHNDAGWLKTVDQYYWGANQSLKIKAGVRYILNSIVNYLPQKAERRFSYCETGFFWRWWRQQSESVRRKAVHLVRSGQLELVGGGWVQGDEAATHYSAVVDQMTLGQRLLVELFGECGRARAAWQIDPFGHSRAAANLFAQMGFTSLFFLRAHYLDKARRFKDKSSEMLWVTSDQPDGETILTSILYRDYAPPENFCFDEFDWCADDPIMDDPELDGYNVDDKVTKFLAYVHRQAAGFRTNHILVTAGSDFQYGNADTWFDNLDKLIFYVNGLQSNGSRVNVLYSTPSCYAAALQASTVSFPTKTDDFFPIAYSDHEYVSGFFSSRPTLKGLVRHANAHLQAVRQLAVVTRLAVEEIEPLDKLRRAVALTQHHDAITGTERQHVAFDYAKRLHAGLVASDSVLDAALRTLTGGVGGWTTCPLLNETVCPYANSSLYTALVYNAWSTPSTHIVRLPAVSRRVAVTDAFGNAVACEVVDSLTGRLNHNDSAPYQIVFNAGLLGLGAGSYRVDQTHPGCIYVPANTPNSNETVVSIANSHLRLDFSRATGLLSRVTHLASGLTRSLSQNFHWYASWMQMADEPASDPYVFRPNGTNAFPVAATAHLTLVNGVICSEARQQFAPWISQIVRLCASESHAEFQWTVGPVPVGDKVSKEVITRFESDIESRSTFFTDANGRQIIKRRRNFQPTYPYRNTEPVAGNYFPVTTNIGLQDATSALTILTDRSHGGSSLRDGSLELMVHRRLLTEAHKSIVDPLNELGPDGRGLVVRGTHWLIFGPPNTIQRRQRVLAKKLFYQPLIAFNSALLPHSVWFTGLGSQMPEFVHLLSLDFWDATSVLIRLENLLQNRQDTIHLSMNTVFKTLRIRSMQKLTLSANRVVENLNDTNLVLKPDEIVTLRCFLD